MNVHVDTHGRTWHRAGTQRFELRDEAGDLVALVLQDHDGNWRYRLPTHGIEGAGAWSAAVAMDLALPDRDEDVPWWRTNIMVLNAPGKPRWRSFLKTTRANFRNAAARAVRAILR